MGYPQNATIHTKFCENRSAGSEVDTHRGDVDLRAYFFSFLGRKSGEVWVSSVVENTTYPMLYRKIVAFLNNAADTYTRCAQNADSNVSTCGTYGEPCALKGCVNSRCMMEAI